MHRQTRDKWIVLGFLWTISLVTYLDRVNMAIAGAPIAAEYKLKPVELGTIFSVFVLGYTLFQVPGGWVGDRFGHKKILIFALIWWSVFTALTAWAGNGFLVPLVGLIPAFWLVRFLIGVGEAATFPCANGLVNRWFLPHQRARAIGFVIGGVGAGAASTPPFIAWLMVRYGWRTSFYVCGAVGLVLTLGFQWIAPGNRPAKATENPIESTTPPCPQQSASADDARALRTKVKTPWKEILRNPHVWILTISNFLFGYVVYVYFSWFYLYLVNIRGFSTLRGSFFATLPFLALALGSPFGGWLSDRSIPRLGRVRARRYVAMAGLAAAALLICLGASSTNPYAAICLLSFAAGCAYVAQGPYWATAGDILPTHSATVSGIMNTGANFGGVLSPTLTPWIADQYGWVPALYTVAGFSLVAAVSWRFIGRSGLDSASEKIMTTSIP